MRLRSLVPLLVLLTAQAVLAAPPAPDVARVLDICRSANTADAAAKGHTLGWPRMTDAQTAAWRKSFTAHNGGPVDLVSWRQTPETGSAALSFWVSSGPSRYKACSYTPADPAALLAALTRHLGKPDALSKKGEGTLASWKRDGVEIGFSQFASAGNLMVLDKPD